MQPRWKKIFLIFSVLLVLSQGSVCWAASASEMSPWGRLLLGWTVQYINVHRLIEFSI